MIIRAQKNSCFAFVRTGHWLATSRLRVGLFRAIGRTEWRPEERPPFGPRPLYLRLVSFLGHVESLSAFIRQFLAVRLYSPEGATRRGSGQVFAARKAFFAGSLIILQPSGDPSDSFVFKSLGAA